MPKAKSGNGPKSVGFIGDIHAGSHVGLYPLDELPPKKFVGVRYLMDCFADLVESWPKLDLLILMGDLIDGRQRKSDGVGLFTTDVGEQAEMATEVLKPLAAKASKIYRVWGTPYHETHDRLFAGLDKTLGVSVQQQVINLEMANGSILNVAHHPASGTALYQGTVADREALWSEIAAYEQKLPDARWIVRAHKHNYFLQETQVRTICMLPAWQLATAWAIKQNLWRFQPSLGGVLMVADDQHPSGYRFIPKLYPPPPEEVTQW